MTALSIVALLGMTAISGSASAKTPQSAAAPIDALDFGIAMHGRPDLRPGFAHFPYVDPNAPQGGRLRQGLVGGFDSLNPFILRGRASRAVRSYVVESLMTRSWDEPFTLYGLIAERVSTPPDRSAVTFFLHPKARFSDGSPITPEDVIWSMEILRDQGRPNHKAYYSQIASAERVGERGVRFVFKAPNRELPLLMGLMPVLSKADWAGRDFQTAGLRKIIGSGPYVIAEAEAGRRILFRKNPDYWGADLPVNRGRFNFAEIEHLYFRDGAAVWEAFTAGQLDLYPEGDPARWASAYDVPAVREGRILRGAFDHGRASGMRGFVFNTRRAVFKDRRVRQALALAFDFRWVNQSFYAGGFTRIRSYYSGSDLGFENPAGPAERALLAPFAEHLPPDALDAAWTPPEGAGDGRNRRNLRAARRLLKDAGWTLTDGRLRDAEGAPFTFEILLKNSGDEERLAQVFADALKALGVEARIRLVDSAQHQERLTRYDYDMTVWRWGLSLSPGEEQRFYWSAAAGAQPGSRNYMGVENPAVDAMIDAMLAAENRTDFRTAVQALDRVLSSGVYVIPFGYLKTDKVAWSRALGKPASTPLYGWGYALDAWWRTPQEARATE